MRPLVLCLALAALACAPPPTATAIEKLTRLGSNHGGTRQLTELDLNDNGIVDAADWQLFESVARRANTALLTAGIQTGVRTRLYGGPPAEAPSVFSALAQRDDGVDISGVPPHRLEEIAIEASWAAAQSRLAALGNHNFANGRHFGGTLQALLPHYNSDTMEPAEVCRAIEEMDIRGVKGSGVPAVAVFDLDSTVWAGNVSETFLQSLINSDIMQPSANTPLQTFLKTVPGIDAPAVGTNSVNHNAALLLTRGTDRSLPKEQQVNPKDLFYNTVALLQGLTPKQVQRVALEAVGAAESPSVQAISRRVFSDEDGCGMRRIVDLLRQRGIEVRVLSATLDVLAEAGGRLLGILPEHVLGSVLEIKDGRYTGEVADSTYYTKGAIIRQWLSGPPLIVFGDSPTSDFSMMQESATVAFMVNPRPRFLQRDTKEAGSRFVGVSFDSTEAELATRK